MIGKLLVLTGFPASGKDSVIAEFLKRNPDFRLLVSHTSRPKRKGEIHGVHYHFVTESEFENLIAGKKLLEHVKTGLYYKGTSLSEFEKILSGENSVWRIELTRFAYFEKTIKESFRAETAQSIIKNSVKILIKPENKKIAFERYRNRDSQSDINDFHIRWNYEMEFFRKNRSKYPNIIINKTGRIDYTSLKIEKIVGNHFAGYI